MSGALIAAPLRGHRRPEGSRGFAGCVDDPRRPGFASGAFSFLGTGADAHRAAPHASVRDSASLRGRPRRPFAAPRGWGPAIGREASQGSISSSSSQMRVFGPSIRPGGKRCFLIKLPSWAQLSTIPRSLRSRSEASWSWGALRLEEPGTSVMPLSAACHDRAIPQN